jgi:hypothetical protein
MAASRGAVVAGGVGLALVGIALLGSPSTDGPPLDPRSDAPDGTSALVTLVDRLGGDVDLSPGLPGAGDEVALLLRDRLDEAQASALGAWVRSGGRLVVADPSSSFAPPTQDLGQDLIVDGDQVLERDVCTIDALAEANEVEAGATVHFDASDTDGTCFGDDERAFVTTRDVRSGDVVAVGGPDLVTNGRLDDADNAVLAAALLAPEEGTRLRIIDLQTGVGSGDRSLAELVSDGVRRAGLQLGIAFLVYAAWRAVRLGRVVREPQPVQIAGSALVRASGRLLERGRAPGEVASVLRTGLRRDLRTRLGAGAASDDALAQLVVDRSGIDPEVARAAVGDDAVTDDEGLLRVARAVASVQEEVLR